MVLVRIYFFVENDGEFKVKMVYFFIKKKHMNRLVLKIFINIVFCPYK